MLQCFNWKHPTPERLSRGAGIEDDSSLFLRKEEKLQKGGVRVYTPSDLPISQNVYGMPRCSGPNSDVVVSITSTDAPPVLTEIPTTFPTSSKVMLRFELKTTAVVILGRLPIPNQQAYATGKASLNKPGINKPNCIWQREAQHNSVPCSAFVSPGFDHGRTILTSVALQYK